MKTKQSYYMWILKQCLGMVSGESKSREQIATKEMMFSKNITKGENGCNAKRLPKSERFI